MCIRDSEGRARRTVREPAPDRAHLPDQCVRVRGHGHGGVGLGEQEAGLRLRPLRDRQPRDARGPGRGAGGRRGRGGVRLRHGGHHRAPARPLRGRRPSGVGARPLWLDRRVPRRRGPPARHRDRLRRRHRFRRDPGRPASEDPRRLRGGDLQSPPAPGRRARAGARAGPARDRPHRRRVDGLARGAAADRARRDPGDAQPHQVHLRPRRRDRRPGGRARGASARVRRERGRGGAGPRAGAGLGGSRGARGAAGRSGGGAGMSVTEVTATVVTPVVLEGRWVRLEPLTVEHAAALLQAASGPRETYGLTLVPGSLAEAAAYIETALREEAARRSLPFATVDRATGRVVGSTRFLNIEYWTWPADNAHQRGAERPDVVEIGATWLAAAAERTPINTEAKLLMLTHAFDRWRVHRVSLMTDARNERSRNAILRVGARFDGVIRAARPSSDGLIRDTAAFSILESEWPAVKQKLHSRLAP